MLRICICRCAPFMMKLSLDVDGEKRETDFSWNRKLKKW